MDRWKWVVSDVGVTLDTSATHSENLFFLYMFSGKARCAAGSCARGEGTAAHQEGKQRAIGNGRNQGNRGNRQGGNRGRCSAAQQGETRENVSKEGERLLEYL